MKEGRAIGSKRGITTGCNPGARCGGSVWGTGGVLMLSLLGCSEPERPPRLDRGPTPGFAGAADPAGSPATPVTTNSGSSSASAANLPQGPFDPNEIYVFGQAGGCPGSIGSLSRPAWYSLGVAGCDVRQGTTVGLFKGNVLYVWPVFDDVQFRVYGPDSEGSVLPDSFPDAETMLANDPLVDTPAREPNSPTRFFASPDGHLVYEGHLSLYEGETLLNLDILTTAALGNDGLVLQNAGDLYVGHMGDASTNLASTPVSNLGSVNLLAVRSEAAGFRVVVVQEPWTLDTPAELWEVDGTGAATLLGAYPQMPADVSSGWATEPGVLSPSGEFYQLINDVSVSRYYVVRRTVAGESAVVYPTTDPPSVVSPGYGMLFTGP
jgi:hypothetical protein